MEEALTIVGKESAAALAKALVRREHPPFFDVNRYAVEAARALRDETSWATKAVEDFLRQTRALSNYRFGQEKTIAALAALVPTSALSAEAKKLMVELASNKKYAPLAAPLAEWASVPKPKAKTFAEPEQEATMQAFAELTALALATSDAKALKRLGARMEKLDRLEARDDKARERTFAACVKRLEAHAKKPKGAAATEVEHMLDFATDS